jgi:hypothetical protein
MQMLYPFSGSIQQYDECVAGSRDSERCRPSSCPLCRSREAMIAHGFYSRTVVDMDLECSIRVRRYLCGECRRTVSLLPEFVLPYMRFTIGVIGSFLKARLSEGQTLKAAAGIVDQTEMPYQRGQDWVRRFRRQAESVSAALAGLVQPVVASDFVSKALGMLEKTGWVRAHRFLFQQLRAHLLGWPGFLAPCGIAVRIGRTIDGGGNPPHNTCMDSESPPA